MEVVVIGAATAVVSLVVIIAAGVSVVASVVGPWSKLFSRSQHIMLFSLQVSSSFFRFFVVVVVDDDIVAVVVVVVVVVVVTDVANKSRNESVIRKHFVCRPRS